MEGGRERDHFTGAAPQSSGDECSGAREIISMANQQLRRDEGHLQNRAGGAMARCGGQVMRPAAALSPAGGPRQGLATVASPVTDQAGLSMKRSLQRFLQKREARRAAAVAPPYAGGGRQAQAMRH
ncbi:hypothetical protein EJB05_14914, partial [Eragrostis curvula]